MEETSSAAADFIDAQLVLLRSFESETRDEFERLRRVQIPQHVGMAAAARALVGELPRTLAAQVQADLSSGALGRQWDAALSRAGGQEGLKTAEAILATAARLLLDQVQRTARYLEGRAAEWTAEAHRLEGRAQALEQQASRFDQASGGIRRSREGGRKAEALQEARRAQRENGEPPGARAKGGASPAVADGGEAPAVADGHPDA